MMNILMTGSSGLIGTQLRKRLDQQGHAVYRMLRSNPDVNPFYWQPLAGEIRIPEGNRIDAVINLAGPSIADGRWTRKRKKLIIDSRVKGTALLADAISRLEEKPEVFISGSAIGFYGDTGDFIVDENSPHGSGFLAEIAQQWEQATQPAVKAGIRTVNIRTGVVLSTDGGMLDKLLLPFRMGLGGIVGSGKQYLSWVSIHEIVSMIMFLLENREIAGAVNLVSPEPVTNRDFTKTLGAVLHRPTVVPMPSYAVKLAFGEMGKELLLAGARVKPTRLTEAGYEFRDWDLLEALRKLLS
jgi:uncharacterized protein (TIGR01777 family)